MLFREGWGSLQTERIKGGECETKKYNPREERISCIALALACVSCLKWHLLIAQNCATLCCNKLQLLKGWYLDIFFLLYLGKEVQDTKIFETLSPPPMSLVHETMETSSGADPRGALGNVEFLSPSTSPLGTGVLLCCGASLHLPFWLFLLRQSSSLLLFLTARPRPCSLSPLLGFERNSQNGPILYLFLPFFSPSPSSPAFPLDQIAESWFKFGNWSWDPLLDFASDCWLSWDSWGYSSFTRLLAHLLLAFSSLSLAPLHSYIIPSSFCWALAPGGKCRITGGRTLNSSYKYDKSSGLHIKEAHSGVLRATVIFNKSWIKWERCQDT